MKYIKIIVAIIGFLAAILTIAQKIDENWVLFKGYDFNGLIVIILFCLVIFLIVLKKQKEQQVNKVNEGIRTLTVYIKDSIDEYANCDDKEVAQTISENFIFKVLCTAESVFRSLTRRQCTASLMLVDGSNELYTHMYGSNANSARISTPSMRKLGTTKGIAGKVFGTGKVVVWNNNDPDFESIRDDYKDFYLSGISAPVLYKGSNTGILNIDCKSGRAFKLKEHKVVMQVLTDVMNILVKLLAQKEESLLSKKETDSLKNQLKKLEKKTEERSK